MKSETRKRFLGAVALAAACFMLGTAVNSGSHTSTASAETTAAETVVVTSPFTAAVAQVKDSVVGVSNYQTVTYSNYGYGNGWNSYGYGYGFGNNWSNGYGGSQQQQTSEELYATGSGVVVAEGYVLTNYHVIEDASSVKVTVGETEYDATVAGYDESLDIAVLMVPNLDLPAVTLGDSDTLQVGDWAICIGNPLSEELSGTVTAGIISGLNRSIESTSTDKYGRRETTTTYMIQTDAAINSGNSGGGMFSVTGELMGIPTLKYSGSYYSTSADIDGIGMCIPINVAKPLIESVTSGNVDVDTSADVNAIQTTTNNDLTGKPRMGITITNLNTSSSLLINGTLPNGVYVTDVEEGAPAAQAGMQAGDIIVEADGTIVTSASQLQSIIGTKNAGDTIAVKVYRVEGLATWDGTTELPDGQYIDLTVSLAVVDVIQQ